MLNLLKRCTNLAAKLLVGSSGISIGKNSSLLYYKLRIRKGCTIDIGSDCDLHCRISFDRQDAAVTIGRRCYIGASQLVCAERIDVGDDVIISWGVTIVDHNSHALDWNSRSRDVIDWKMGAKDWSGVKTGAVTIRDKVWIGFNASILKGVVIGEGAVVAANANVTRDVAPYTVVGGNPARSLGKIEANAIVRAD